MSTNTIMQFFEYDHLKGRAREVSSLVATLAMMMDSDLDDGPEKSAGLRKLLEAKDCFVRSTFGTSVCYRNTIYNCSCKHCEDCK